MREIKFRAYGKIKSPGNNHYVKDGKTGKPVERMFSQVDIRSDGFIMVNDECMGDYFNILDGEVMQFTGMKDKNEKDIYEGDIVVFYEIEYPSRKAVRQEGVHIVEYGLFGFKYVETGKPNEATTYMSPKLVEVIGNIYENKEIYASSKM